MMQKIKGKNIDKLKQNNFLINTDTILVNNSVNNKEYLMQQLNEYSGGIHQSKLNTNMIANNAIKGQKACELAVIEFPLSMIIVKINGQIISTGYGMDCYFSPDGVLIRDNGNAEKGDYLYWNRTDYSLDPDDEIDFDYLTGYGHKVLLDGTDVELSPLYNSIVVKYTGGENTNMNITIDNTVFVVGNVNGSFVFDIGGSQEHLFTSINEGYVISVNNQTYTIWFDGFGSLLYSVKKGDYKPDILFNIGTGFSDNNIRKIIKHGDKYVAIGSFTTYQGITANRIIRINNDGSIDTTFVSGTGFNATMHDIILDGDKYLIMGKFTSYNGVTTQQYLIRLNSNGSIDTTFVTGTGLNSIDTSTSSSSLINNEGNYVLAGKFTAYKGIASLGLLVINKNGDIVKTFPTMFNNSVWFIYQDENNRYILSGAFTTVNSISKPYLVRLNSDFTLDTTFTIYPFTFHGNLTYAFITCVIRANNKYLLLGAFKSYNGINSKNIIRVNDDGTIDNTFNSGVGLNILSVGATPVYGIIDNNKYTICSWFDSYNNTPANNIIQLNYDGTTDNTFKQYGTGFSEDINHILNDGKFYTICGYFKNYDGKIMMKIARIYKDGKSNTKSN